MKRIIMGLGLTFTLILQGIGYDVDRVYRFVQKDLRDTDLSQSQLLFLLQNQKRLMPQEPRLLIKPEHTYIKSLVTLLGLRSELDGFLDPQAYEVFKKLPPEVMKDCIKAMRRTWSLDKEFCLRKFKVDVYALPHDKLLEIQSSANIAKLLPSMLVPELSQNRCEREAELKRKSSFVFELSYSAVRTEKGKLFNRLEKRCTVDDFGYIEVINLKKATWQELYFLHELALVNQLSLQNKVVTARCAQIKSAYKSLDDKYKVNLEKPNKWNHFFKKAKPSSFDLRLQEIELC